MMPSITPLGKRWEYLHSFWLLWLLGISKHGYLSFILFFYIGVRTWKWKWILSGCGYLFIVIIFITVKQLGLTETFIFDATLGVFLTSYVLSWVHAFWSRKEYLQIIADRQIDKKQQQEEMDMTPNNTIDDEMNERISQSFSKAQLGNLKPIHINTASRSEIAEITGDELAADIIKARKKVGAFTSIIDLIRVVQIKPHKLAEIKKYFIFTKQTNDPSMVNQQPIKKTRGRMVDY